MRKQHPIIVYGKYELLLPEDENLYVYTRTLEEKKLLVVCSFSDRETAFLIPEEFVGADCMLSNRRENYKIGEIVLEPYEAFVLHRK